VGTGSNSAYWNFALSIFEPLTGEIETPFWGDLVRKSHISSIPLQPLRKTQHPGFMKKPSSDIFFRASLTGDLTGLEIADRLKAAPPKAVTAVNIEAVVLRARAVQRQDESCAFPPRSIFNKLPAGAQKEILQQFQELNTVMAKSTTDARSSVTKSDDETISRAYESIAHAVSAVCSAIETPILLDLSPEDLEAALQDKSAIAAGAVDSITLRQSLLQDTAVSDDLELPRGELKLENSERRFRTGFVAGKPILAEFFSYTPKPETGDPYPESMEQVQRMTALLCHPKRTSFHILPCAGYVHDKFNHSFGLVFETPRQFESGRTICLLSELYESQKTLALGDRISLAYKLTVAVENFHRVGWVHKALRSSNILFLPSAEPLIHLSDEKNDGHATTPTDLSTPWLFGFEYARAHDAGTKLVEDHNTNNNLYRHPYRWGRPTVSFTKAHDVYSLASVPILCMSNSNDSHILLIANSLHKMTGSRALRDRLLEEYKGADQADRDGSSTHPIPRDSSTDQAAMSLQASISSGRKLCQDHLELSPL
jgi:hypothetical protein